MTVMRAVFALAAWGQLIGAGALSVALAEVDPQPGRYIDYLPIVLLAGAGFAFWASRLAASRT